LTKIFASSTNKSFATPVNLIAIGLWQVHQSVWQLVVGP
jgi:hypothetical protein